ncbi:uncharacterized protein LOC128103333 isoform X2 [Peromyscus californicus insignis]|uniref:uncharacterized protein LOC128103333 isoform X2 n=1 Tax=Peromyscus californicus insignis TaxID=564181 RepID=UPI0022A74508|nr:uncharacterized protein LOC128103333 isoform X2 [Peromyscus californicus insignis]
MAVDDGARRREPQEPGRCAQLLGSPACRTLRAQLPHPPPLSPARATPLRTGTANSALLSPPPSARVPGPWPLAPGPWPAAGAQGRQWPAFSPRTFSSPVPHRPAGRPHSPGPPGPLAGWLARKPAPPSPRASGGRLRCARARTSRSPGRVSTAAGSDASGPCFRGRVCLGSPTRPPQPGILPGSQPLAFGAG